jgi:hypothetical protein
MSKIIIKDLNESKSLDRAAMASIRGGLSIGNTTNLAKHNQIVTGRNNAANVIANSSTFAPPADHTFSCYR